MLHAVWRLCCCLSYTLHMGLQNGQRSPTSCLHSVVGFSPSRGCGLLIFSILPDLSGKSEHYTFTEFYCILFTFCLSVPAYNSLTFTQDRDRLRRLDELVVSQRRHRRRRQKELGSLVAGGASTYSNTPRAVLGDCA